MLGLSLSCRVVVLGHLLSNFRLDVDNFGVFFLLNVLSGALSVAFSLSSGLVDHLLSTTLTTLASTLALAFGTRLTLAFGTLFTLLFSRHWSLSHRLSLFLDHLSLVMLGLRPLLLSNHFCFSRFENFVFGLFQDPFFIFASLGLFASLSGFLLGFLFALGLPFVGFESLLAANFLFLALLLAFDALALDFVFAIASGLLLLLASLSLMPLELVEVLVLFGRVVSFQVFFNLLGVELLTEADVNDLVIVKRVSVVFASMLLVVLHDVPLLFVQLNQLLVACKFLVIMPCGSGLFPGVATASSTSAASFATAATLAARMVPVAAVAVAAT